MRLPTATYRIQFTADFGFDAARAIASYLADLGISDLYASPIFKARPGSTHGYDVVDPNQLNPELGPAESFEALVRELQGHRLGWLQDIVPNHMAYDSQNQYLMNVLENGPASIYANYFDMVWNTPFVQQQERILAPLLGDFYSTCLENGEIQLKYDQGGFSVNYYSLKIPLKLESYLTILGQNLSKLARTLGRKHPDFIKLLGVLYMLKSMPAEVAGNQRQDQADFIKYLLWELYTENAEIQAFFDENITTLNGEKGQPESFDRLDHLLSDQFFRLAYWKVGTDEMNYRRFFTVNELISIRVEDLAVFRSTHALVSQLAQRGIFTGLRIDHIDGLYDPTLYLERLREEMGDRYITVEKILELGEDLPQPWQIQGTSGYDFLNYVNGILCNTENQEIFDSLYWEFSGNYSTFEQVVNEKKRLFLDKRLAGDLDNLATLLKQIASKNRYGNDFTINGLRAAIAEVLVQFPVYRTYIAPEGVLESDRPYLAAILQAARESAPLLKHELNFIEKLLLLEYDNHLTPTEKEQWLYFVMRLQQYTGPLMAKGVEDTALYVYNRLVSLNEVGGNPASFGISLAEFHQFNQHRRTRWPHTMNATATHDTKRGEDVRARLNVLSEMPEEWREQLRIWGELNRTHKQRVKGQLFPHNNDEYLLYQTLVGAFPFDPQELPQFTPRVKDYLIKAIREAKVFTTWLEPNPTYENACLQFIDKILDPAHPFLAAFLPFQQRIAAYGLFNSLTQTLLKITTPGLPDFYQGTELWDLSLVDPDNRRPVDFQQRQSWLHTIQQQIDSNLTGLIAELRQHREDGRIKLFLITQALKARRQYLDVFQQGSYTPIEATGPLQNHVVAFARSHQNTTLLTVAPRFLTRLVAPEQEPLGESVWQETALQLPPAFHPWENLLTGEAIAPHTPLKLSRVLRSFPIALLVNRA